MNKILGMHFEYLQALYKYKYLKVDIFKLFETFCSRPLFEIIINVFNKTIHIIEFNFEDNVLTLNIQVRM